MDEIISGLSGCLAWQQAIFFPLSLLLRGEYAWVGPLVHLTGWGSFIYVTGGVTSADGALSPCGGKIQIGVEVQKIVES